MVTRLQRFPFRVRYRKGSEHQDADALSRLPLFQDIINEPLDKAKSGFDKIMVRDIRELLWKMSLDADYLFPGGDDLIDNAIVGTVIETSTKDIDEETTEPMRVGTTWKSELNMTPRHMNSTDTNGENASIIYCHVCTVVKTSDENGQPVTETVQILEDLITREVTERTLNSTGIVNRSLRTLRHPTRDKDNNYS